MQAETQTLARKSVVGVFDSQAEADAALEQLRAQGVAPEEISVMSRDAQPTEETEVARPASPVAVGAATGATLGGALGVLLGWMEAIGSIQIPGIVVGTPSIPGVGTPLGDAVLAATLVGLLLGAAVGGLIGALLGLTVRVDRTQPAETKPHEGRLLVTVHPSQALDVESVGRIMQASGGYDVRIYDLQVVPSMTTDEAVAAQGMAAAAGMPATSEPVESAEAVAMADTSDMSTMSTTPSTAESAEMQATTPAEASESAAMSEMPETPTQPLTPAANMAQEPPSDPGEMTHELPDTTAPPAAEDMPKEETTPGTDSPSDLAEKNSGQ